MSAVQFNLLPDVKLEFNRAEHAKRVVYALSALAVIIALALFIISFLSVDVLQKKLLSDANGDITKYSNQLKSIPDLDKILTVQNQLGSLPGLHQQKHIASRLFAYLPQLTPANANVGKLSLDTSASSIEIDGTADSVQTINKFVDTLKFTTFATANNKSTQTPAFNNVILTKVDRNDNIASYTINANFNQSLFAADQNVQLTVPQEVTTRSCINAPRTTCAQLFNGQTGAKTTQKGGQ